MWLVVLALLPLEVLDSARRKIGHESWQPAELEIRDDWVRPLPDGSGYCWVRFTRSTFEVLRRRFQQ